MSRRDSEPSRPQVGAIAGSDPSALFWESLRLVAGLAVGVVVVGVSANFGFDVENNLYAQLSAGPIIITICGLVYWKACADPAGPELGVRPGEGLAWPESPRSWLETLKAILLGTLVIIAGSIVLSNFIELLGIEVAEQTSIVELTKPVQGELNPAVFMLAPMALLAAPLVEELVFRGLYFRRLLARVGAVPAFVASAAAFAMIHGNPTGTPIYLLQAVIFGGVYRYTGRLSAAVAVHFLNNAITLAILLAGGNA